jgi:hypothetical protein
LDHFEGRKSEDFAENLLPRISMFTSSRVEFGRTLVVFPNKSEAFVRAAVYLDDVVTCSDVKRYRFTTFVTL